MNQDEFEKIKRALDAASVRSKANEDSTDDFDDRSEWMDQLENRVDEFILRMNQLRNRIGLKDNPTDQLEDHMHRLEGRARRLDRTAKRLLGEKIRPQQDTDDE